MNNVKSYKRNEIHEITDVQDILEPSRFKIKENNSNGLGAIEYALTVSEDIPTIKEAPSRYKAQLVSCHQC